VENEKTDKPDEAVEQRGSASGATATVGSARRSAVLSIIAAVIGLVVAFYSIFGSFIFKGADDLITKKLDIEITTLRALQEDKLRLQPIIDRINNLEQHISSLANIPKEDALYIELQKLGNSVGDLNSREAKIETVILENPAKALEMPLLRRDLDNAKEAQQAALVSLKESVDRIYDLSKWLLGAMAVSIVTLAVVNLLKPKETKP
jgi:hypothetical protein